MRMPHTGARLCTCSRDISYCMVAAETYCACHCITKLTPKLAPSSSSLQFVHPSNTQLAWRCLVLRAVLAR